MTCRRKFPPLSSPRRRRSTPFAPAAGSPMPPRFSGLTSPVCSCATGGCRIAATALHCTTCLSHLLRRCKELLEDHPGSLWARHVQAVLQTGFAVRDRCNDGDLSEHGLASLRGRLLARLGRLVDAPPPLEDTERFARHLADVGDLARALALDLGCCRSPRPRRRAMACRNRSGRKEMEERGRLRRSSGTDPPLERPPSA